MSRTTYGIIRSCLTQDIKYHVMTVTSTRKIWDILESKYLTKSVEKSLAPKEEALSLSIEKRNLDRGTHERLYKTSCRLGQCEYENQRGGQGIDSAEFSS